jgi:hypothetical protein
MNVIHKTKNPKRDPKPVTLMDHLLKRAIEAEIEAERYRKTCNYLNDLIELLKEKINELNLQLSSKRLQVK